MYGTISSSSTGSQDEGGGLRLRLLIADLLQIGVLGIEQGYAENTKHPIGSVNSGCIKD